MKAVTSVLLAGVGGQGTILMSRVFTAGLISAGFDVKMSEVHGMAQRGGSVSTQVRYGEAVFSPIIGRGEADVLVAFEKMEAVRYAEYLKPGATAVINDQAILPLPVATGAAEYPEGLIAAMQAKFRTIVVPASDIAGRLGSPKSTNIVLLGALVRVLMLETFDWRAAIGQTVPARALELNLAAFAAGLDMGGRG